MNVYNIRNMRVRRAVLRVIGPVGLGLAVSCMYLATLLEGIGDAFGCAHDAARDELRDMRRDIRRAREAL